MCLWKLECYTIIWEFRLKYICGHYFGKLWDFVIEPYIFNNDYEIFLWKK